MVRAIYGLVKFKKYIIIIYKGNHIWIQNNKLLSEDEHILNFYCKTIFQVQLSLREILYICQKLIELYSTVNHSIHKVEKSFGSSGDPRMECRLGQINLTAL